MKLLILGRGKTGSLVAEVASHCGHDVSILDGQQNHDASALTPDLLRSIDAVIDFTNPTAVVQNIESCVRAKTNMVVGTTGWSGDLAKVRQVVEEAGTGFVYGANFSIGVNLFYDVARAASAALRHQYSGQIFERHHANKKDAPSGTASELKRIIRDASSAELEITSFREGDVVGMHEVILNSSNDTIYLCHDAKSRRGFAEGAVMAAEWLAGKTGFFDFRDIWQQI
jgi:4-hydroxy-tetrahydrodipicolinate reductase